ncbi:MAG: hypothetical protein ACTSYU_05515 [Promethearchaeota archaeon]
MMLDDYGNHMMDWDTNSGMMNWSDEMMGFGSIFGVLTLIFIVFLVAYMLKRNDDNRSEISRNSREASVHHQHHATEVPAIKKLPSNTTYCTNCGSRIENEHTKYCSQCGAAII